MANFDKIAEFSLDQVLARRLGTPGGAVAPTVAPEIFPNITLENDRPEWGYLKGEIQCGIYNSLAAVAGQYSMFQFYLPSTARTIAVITSIKSGSANTTQVSRLIGISGGLAGWSALAPTTRDFRTSGNGTSVIVETNANVALPARFTALDVLRAVGEKYEQPIVITPGTALGIFGQAVNTGVILTVSWYERQAQPGELL